MPGSIQSIERAAAVLHFLGAVPEPVPLGELSRMLALPKPTVHGIVRTLVDVGFVVQDPDSGRYTLGEGLSRLGETLDPHLLRSRSVNWADGLAARTGLEVQLGVLAGQGVELLHHVFRPDGSPQRLRVGELQPLHATALGHVLLAFSPAASRLQELVSSTGSTPTSPVTLTRAVQQAFRRGWAVADGTLRPGVAAIAAPVRHHLGIGVGALAVVGPRERVLSVAGDPVPALVEQVVAAAAAVSAHLEDRL
ncbi:IclR family transcriptional regulator [Nocardioides sp.]|uniref:IclR family transcriptional regulator n=1 Tax=Nocardioides sp. TaxID=35761 RepID=UPI00271B70C2|nr:IclR family transcriptional regulator [Nocardioides sp.]MDO9457991.1 IclR family transcriptional regulator [Nocardioides sp.]